MRLMSPDSTEKNALMRSLYGPLVNRWRTPRRSPGPSSPTVPTNRMSSRVPMPAAFIARTKPSSTDMLMVSSPMPGADSRVPWRLTLTSVPAGKTVSMWAETTTTLPSPRVPLRRPVTLPSASICTSARPTALSIFSNSCARTFSPKGGDGISVRRMPSSTMRPCSLSSVATAVWNAGLARIRWAVAVAAGSVVCASADAAVRAAQAARTDAGRIDRPRGARKVAEARRRRWVMGR